ncbi:hypothetical protein QA541_08080 [Macrococcus psychrotolerans]|uniref:Uncharacterized protein n=1 Tax=Macrococcus psychrotolerans TaxID=3039389 RepID=A0AAU6R8S1_9STAP
MELHLKLMHRLLCCFNEDPNKDYMDILDDMEIINLLIDMKLIEVYSEFYLNLNKSTSKLFINVTSKGQIFISEFNNQS